MSPLRLADSAALGSRAARAMTVAISNAAGGELGWSATRLGASPWLSLSVSRGTAPTTLEIVADPAGLAVGVFADTVVVMARSPGRGEVRIPIQFVIHPCMLRPVTVDGEVTGQLDGADCTGPHRSAMFADLYSFTGSAGDSVSVELESTDFAPYLVLDTAAGSSAPPLAETGVCAHAPGTPCLRYQRLPRTGTYVIEATTAVVGDSGAYQLRLFRPRTPSPVDSLAQLGSDSATVIALGGVSADSTIVLRGTASDPDGGDSLRLEVEVRAIGMPFTGSATAAGALVPAGDRAFVRLGVSDNTAYYWRARVVDQTGRASAWRDFGGNDASPDVGVAVNDIPSAPAELGQFKGNPLTGLVVGGLTDDATMVFRGTVLDPDPGDSLQLEVEVRALGTPFTGLPTASGALVPSGTIASATMAGLADQTQYHWQARTVDRSGRATAWTSFGDNTEASIDFHVSLPKMPAPPSDPGQFRLDGLTPIAAGDTIPERSIRLRAMLIDANPGDQLRLELELQPFAAPFVDAASATSEPVASGEVATVAITGLPENTSYHWQVRVVDQSGRSSAWTAFGPNPGAPDFHVRVPAVQLVFAIQPSTTGSGAAIAVRVAAQDGEGNTLASFTAPITVALRDNPAGGALAGTQTVTAVAGLATFADLRIDRAGTGYSLVASATNGGPAAATSNVFGITPGSAARLAIMTPPSGTASSGIALSQQPVIQLLDAAGNPVSQPGIAVGAAILSGGGTLGGTTVVLTDASGVALFTDLMIAGTVGPRLLEFTGAELAGVTSGAVDLTPGVPATLVKSSGDSLTGEVGSPLAGAHEVTVLDAHGNPVADVPVSWAVGSDGSVSPALATTDINGRAGAIRTLGERAGIQTTSATAVLSNGPITVTFKVHATAGSATRMTVQAGDSQVDTVGQTLPIAHAVRVTDQFDNPVPDVLITWGVLEGGGSVNPLSSFTDVNGIASTSWTLGTARTPTDSVQLMQATGVSSPLILTAFTVPGPVSATETSITAFPATIAASSGGSASTVTITVRDAFGNVIKGKSVALAASGTGNTLTPSAATDVNGVATGALAATYAEQKIVSVTIDGVEITQTAAVVVTPAGVSGEQSTVTVSPGMLTAGVSSATITVTARDPFGNPIQGATAVLAATGAGNTLTHPATTTDPNGVATGTLSATAAGVKVISATIEGTEVTQTALVAVTAAGLDVAQSSVVATPGSITASNGASSATITATARDQFGNPIAGVTVVLAATGNGNVLTQPALTDANGVATGSLSATTAGAKVVSATIGETGIAQTATVTVTAAPVSGEQSSVTAALGTFTASSGERDATITVTARDQFGNAIAGATVMLTATGTGNTLTQPETPTDGNGTATGRLSATGAGEKIISATIDGAGVTQTASVTVLPAAVSAEQSTVAAGPASITAGTGTATITVTARDQFGNPIEGATVVLAATGIGNALTQPIGPTTAGGVSTGALSATGVGDKIISATIAGTGVTQTTAVTVNAAGVSAAQSTVSAGPTTLMASTGASSAIITVTARDQFDNPIPGAAVALAVTGSGNTLTQPGPTNANGVTTGTLSATASGEKMVSATIDETGVTQAATVTVTPAGVDGGQSTVLAGPNTITASAGASSATITVTARDEFGNPIEGATVVLAATGSANTLSQPASTTDANGVAIGSLSATSAGSKTVAVTINGTNVTETAAVTVTPAGVNAGQSTVSASPDAITASDGASSASITVTARDQFGNPIEGATVVLAATGGGNTLSQPTSTTDASGVAIGSLSATEAETKTVSVTIDGLVVTQSAAVTVAAAGVSAEQSTVSAMPGTITASNGASSATIAVNARDQFGNPIEGATVLLAATGAGNALTQPGPTDANGMASGTLSATAAEDKLVSATINGTPISQTATVTTEPAGADAAQSTVVVAPGSITAGSGVATITVTARDQFGNPVEGAAVVATATGIGNMISQPAASTSSGGAATATLSSTAAGIKTISATINGAAITQTAAVTVTPAGVSAVQSTVAATPSAIAASNGTSSATIAVTARDQFGNVIAGATVALAATGTGNTLTQPVLTDASGVATGTLSATVAEDKIVSATINGTTLAQTAALTVTPAQLSADHSSVTAAPGSIVASGGENSATITVTARDQFGNLIEGVPVVLAATGAGNTVTQPATTDATGVATGTLSSTGAGAKVVLATVGGTAITQTATVSVTPAGVSAAQSMVIAAPEAITASTGASSASITVTARDQFGNPIEGATVVLAATGTGNTLTQPGATDPSGVATGTLSATGAGAKVVSATINGTPISQTATVTTEHAGADATQSAVTVSPGAITAGSGVATITVTARDQFGNPIGGATVVLAASGNGNSLTQPGALTDASGVATGFLRATGAGEKMVSATIDGTGATQTGAVTVTPAGVSAAQSTVTVAPASVVASDGSSSATITITARDEFGNPIQGATVLLAATGSGNALTQPGTTGASGLATGSLSATAAENKVVSATIEGTAVTQTATIAVTAGPVSATQSTVAAGPASITAGSGVATITVTARDQFGNPIEGAAAVVTATGTGNTVTQPTTTNAAGVATGSLTATVAEGKIVSVTIDGTGISQTAAVTVTPAAVNAAQSTVAVAIETITASTGASSTTITVTARDQFGNSIEGATVVLAASGSGNSLTQPATPTGANGTATGTLSATVAENKVISAMIDGTGVTQTVTVTTTPAEADAAQSTVAAAPGSITAGSDVASVTVTARDQFGNPIEGATVVLAATGNGNTLAQPGVTSASGVAIGTLSATGAGQKVVSATIDGTGVTQTATLTVTPAGVSAGQSSLTAAPGAITAGSDIATITVTARDPFGNPIQGAIVALAATGNGNTLTQPAGSTDAGGAATATLSSTAAEAKTISATIDGTAITQIAAVTVGHAGVDAAQATVVAAPETLTASNGTNAATITVIARDPFGNPIPDATVVLEVTGSGNTLTQPATTTDANGVTTGALSATVAGDRLVSATIDGLTVTQTALVSVGAAGVSAAQSTVTAAPGTITASNGESSATIAVVARDAFDNPIQGASVVLAATHDGNTLTQPATTDASGTTTGTLSATLAGDKVVSATINGTEISQTAAIMVSPAGVSALQSTLTTAPATVTASNGSSSTTITVTARDQFGNPIEGGTVVLAASGSGNTLTQPAMTTAANGSATGTLSATMAETKTVTATVDGLAITQQGSVLVTPAAAQALVFRVQPTNATAGASITPVEVEVRDEFANRVTDAASGVALAIATNPAGGTLTGGDAVVAVDGIASFAGLSVDKAGAGYTLEASSTGLIGATSAGFMVTAGAVSPAQSTVAVAPESLTAGSGVATITVTALDAFGNPIEGAAVALAATGTGNTLIQPATTTDANGVATGTVSATGAGEKLVSATIAGTAVTQTATLTVVAAGVDPAQATVLAAPETIMASSGANSTIITVTARDQFGNPIPGATVMLAAGGTGHALTQPGTATDANGVATGTLSATAAGSKIITATVAGVPVTQQASVLVTPADADHLVFLAQPTNVTADATITPPVEVEIRDPFDNRATSATHEVTLAIAANPAGGSLTGSGPVAAVNGVASFPALNVDKAGAGYTLAAASPGLSDATSDPFTVMPGAVSPVRSTVIAAPASIPVGSGVTTITVTARDANDNPIPSATVVLAAAGTAPLLTQPAGQTATDGTATGTLSATLSGGKTVSAVISGTPIAQTATVTVQPPPGSVVLVGAGDIGDCEWTTDDSTAALLDTIPGTVFTAGDNAYPDGTADDFTNCYEPTWGRHKARTRPSPGNHDYRTQSATAYYAYFGASAGSGGWGFYSYDLGDWHIISLNSEIGMSVGSTQEAWLRADLAANTKQCTLAYWHRPLFSSGDHGSLVKSKPIWRALQDFNAEVVVVGHDHNYERFAPQDTIGVADPERGLREFVVGTGGTELRSMSPPIANSEVQNSDTHGVLKFTLYSTGYEWEFIPIAGKTFTDSGSGACH